MLKPVRSKADLIALALPHAPSAACARALREGRVVCWGAFAFTHSFGWVLEATGQKTIWRLAVLANEAARQYTVKILSEIPWVGWSGTSQGLPNTTNGDNPELSAHYRRKAVENERASQETHFV